MADDTPTPVAGSAGLINPLLPNAFILGDATNLSMEELKRRRAIALALAARAKGYPKTFGEGLTYLGESIGDRLAEERLVAAERAYTAKETGTIAKNPLVAPPGVPAPAAAVAPPSPAIATPSPIAPPSGPTGAFTPVPVVPTERRLPAGITDPALISGDAGDAVSPDERKNRLAALLMPEGVGQANPTVGAPSTAPRGPQLASLSPLATMSDAPPIGAPRPMPDVENPPTPTDIQPMPRLAQVGTGTAALPGGAAMGPNPVPMPADPRAAAGPSIGTIPGAFDLRKPAIAPSTATGFRVPDLPPFAKPKPPDAAPMDPDELRGYQIMQSMPDSPRVQAHGAAIMSQGKQRREMINAQRDKDYKADTDVYEKRLIAWEEAKRTQAKTDQELQDKIDASAQKQREQTLFPLGKEQAVKFATESYGKVEKLPDAVQAIADIRNVLNSKAGIYSGKFANQKLELAKAGIAMGREDPTAVNTEFFRGLVPPLIAALRPTIVGSGQQALPEFEQLQKAAAGDINLEKGAILNIIGKVEQHAQRAAVQHAETLMRQSGGDPGVRQSLASLQLPMEKFVPPVMVEKLKSMIELNKTDVPKVKALMEEFDKDYYTPGLSARILGVGR